MKSNELDQIDKQILNLLQGDAALTSKEIAISLSRSVSTINERILRLQKRGIITHYIAVLNKEKTKDDYYTFFTHIQLTLQTKKTSENFTAAISDVPEILSCHHVTGDSDFILKIRVKDIPSYYELLFQKINKICYVGGIKTYMTLSEDKDETTLPVHLFIAFLILDAVRFFM